MKKLYCFALSLIIPSLLVLPADATDQQEVMDANTYNIAAGNKSVRIEIVGYFRVEVDTSVEGSMEIPGFISIGGSIGNTLIYESDAVVKSRTYRVS